MLQYFPHCNFKWVRNIDKFDVSSISENRPIVSILEVDLNYPD